MFWKDNNSIEIVTADDKPFTVCNNVDAMLYNKNMSIVKFAGLNNRTTDKRGSKYLEFGKKKGSKIEELNDD
jgi:hypothetical protein